MSAKGRGGPVVEHEFYGTPPWCTRRILEELVVSGHMAPVSWCEPCAGEHAITRQLVKFLGSLSPMVRAGDIRTCDPEPGVTTVRPWTSFSEWVDREGAIITNPPFSLAPELIRHFLPRCDWLILLLRASFRLGEWRHNMPDEYKLPQRPEFLASYKCKKYNQQGGRVDGCGWNAKVPISTPRMNVCPSCGAANPQLSTSDSSEYSWFVWTPERNRSAGLTRVLPDTPLEERKER